MISKNYLQINAKLSRPDDPMRPAIFSLEESKSYYLVSVDVPTIPATETEILSKRNELTIEGKSVGDQKNKKQTYFRCKSNEHGGIKATYQDGVLWLLLPKVGMEILSQPSKIFSHVRAI